ncbi:MAG: HEAT repeat domain-containing protein [Planctomycetota bacterium]
MKPIVFVWMFAAALAAQDAPKVDAALAQAIAVEEQERDLAKAERLYREVLAAAATSDTDRATANLRLGRLLQKLGRGDEAKAFLAAGGKGAVVSLDDVTDEVAQDTERIAELRAKAEELVRQAKEQGGGHTQELLWIGEAGVPVVIAALERGAAARGFDSNLAASLASVLWAVGGKDATQFLRRAAGDPKLATWVVTGMRSIQRPEMWKVAEVYLRMADFSPLRTHLRNQTEAQPRRPVVSSLDAGAVVDAMATGDAERKAWLLENAWLLQGANDGTLALEVVDRIVALARDALRSIDPQLGLAARTFALSPLAQRTRAGIEMLLNDLQRLPDFGRVWQGQWSLTPDDWRALLPQIDACAAALQHTPEGDNHKWLANVMRQLPRELGAEVMSHILRWFELGYQPTASLYGRVTTDNAPAVLALVDRVPAKESAWLVRQMAEMELPRGLFAALRAMADRVEATDAFDLFEFVQPMANTGDPAAAGSILDLWQTTNDDSKRTRGAAALHTLLERNPDEAVRAAARVVVANLPPSSSSRDRLVADLIHLSDTAVLPEIAKRPSSQALHLLLEAKDPPEHHYSEAQLDAFVTEAARQGHDSVWNPRGFTTDLISDHLLMRLADAIPFTEPPQQVRVWPGVAVGRLNRANGTGPLATWLLAKLDAGTCQWHDLYHLSNEAFATLRPQLEQRLDSTNGSVVTLVADHMLRRGLPLDPDRLLRSDAEGVRAWVVQQTNDGLLKPTPDLVRPLLRAGDASVRAGAAKYLGACVDREAVPGLLEQLRDADADVRAAAAEALTRIRFYHEQQAHWDRVSKGLDASPGSAAEKLLLQARPGAQKAQRLLAITSLGVLGVPEALPFLIDWTTDPDAEIAQKAREAIQQIHLQPRR